MYGIPEHCQPLSPAEEQVLLAVWACRPPATRRDIGEKLAAKGWAPATVLNFLYRLEKKGWVKSGKDQNRNRPSGPSSARAAAARASWNRPWPSWPKSTLKRKNMICMTHTDKARAKTEQALSGGPVLLRLIDIYAILVCRKYKNDRLTAYQT